MLVMRAAAAADRNAVAQMMHARCSWMEERGLPSWRPSVDDLAGQCDNPCGDVWLLEMDGPKIVGRTTVQEQGPPWGWSENEQAEPAFYLNTTVTDPAHRHLKLGTLVAWWAVDQAARRGAGWVRRDCLWPELVAYYEGQGFTLVREVVRGKHRFYLMARRAEHIDLTEWFRTGTPVLPGADR